MSRDHSRSVAWVIDIYHPDGVIRAATTDLWMDSAVATLGAFYPGLCKSPDLTIQRRFSAGFWGIVIPSVTSALRFNARSIDPIDGTWITHIDPTANFRNVGIRIRKYDWINDHLIGTRFSGVIKSADPIDGDIIVSCSSAVETVMRRKIPGYTVKAADFPKATDLGRPIPVPFGRCLVRPPYVGNVDDALAAADYGGYDFAVGWHEGNTVAKVWDNVDKVQEGLESLSNFRSAPGTPVYVSPTTFTVTPAGDLSQQYVHGGHLRCKTTASGTEFVDTLIDSYAAGTVTLMQGVLDAGMNTVQIGGDYEVDPAQLGDTPRYDVGGEPITTLRLFGPPDSGMLVEVIERRADGFSLTNNPPRVLDEIFTNPIAQWGLGQSTNATTVDDTADAFADAGMDHCFNGALAWSGNQTTLERLLADPVFAFMWIEYDAANSHWDMFPDTQPAEPTLVFGRGDGVYNNVINVLTNATIPVNEAPSKVKLRYGNGGRRAAPDNLVGGNGETGDYLYEIEMDVFQASIFTPTDTEGEELILASDYLNPPNRGTPDHVYAKRILDRIGKTYLYGDRRPAIHVGWEGEEAVLGHLVRYIDPADDIDDSFRVVGINERAADADLYLMGYDSAVHSDTSAGIDDPDEPERDETTGRRNGANQLRNANFGARGPTSVIPTGTADSTSVPFWYIFDTNGHLSITWVRDSTAKGGFYLEVVVTGSDVDLAAHEPLIAAMSSAAVDASAGFEITPHERRFFSFYCDAALGLKIRNQYLDDTPLLCLSQPAARYNIDSRDVSAKGWKRHWGLFTAPADGEQGSTGDAASCFPQILFQHAGTYRIDAAMFEAVGRGQVHPSPWVMGTYADASPSQNNAGPLPQRGNDDDPVMGTYLDTEESGVINLLGGSPIAVLTIPAGSLVFGITGKVREGITYSGGGTGWSLGFASPANTGTFARALARNTLDQTFNSLKDVTPSHGIFPVAADTIVYVMPNAGAFTDGQLEFTLHYLRLESYSN